MPVSYILNTGAELVGKKWRAVILWHLQKGPLRFSQLRQRIPGVSVKVLSEVLDEMETNELIIRKQYNTIPVKTTYEVHPDAHEFLYANYICTIKIGEYIVHNAERLQVPPDMLLKIQQLLDKEAGVQ
jgi:DNA-binding HxlR family transcriptional regulator